jgi:hypothetical protein
MMPACRECMCSVAFDHAAACRFIDDVATATRVVDEHTIASLGSQLLRELDLSTPSSAAPAVQQCLVQHYSIGCLPVLHAAVLRSTAVVSLEPLILLLGSSSR